MQYATLGTTDINASRVALGVMRINSLSREEAQEIVTTALNEGINFFDTADCYSAGKSSVALGEALETLGIAHDDIYIETKFGIVRSRDSETIHRYDFSKKHLVAALEGELKNLRTDHVDFALLHRPDTLVDLDELAEAFNELESSGKVLHFGVSNVNPSQVELLQSGVKQRLEVNQLQFGLGHTGMVDQEFHVNMTDPASIDHDGGILAYSRLKHMTIQAWSPFQYGFFEGVFIDNPKFPELNAELDKLAQEFNVSKSAIAVAWILRHPANMQVLLGSMTPSRIREMAAGSEVQLSAQQWYDLYVATGHDLP